MCMIAVFYGFIISNIKVALTALERLMELLEGVHTHHCNIRIIVTHCHQKTNQPFVFWSNAVQCLMSLRGDYPPTRHVRWLGGQNKARSSFLVSRCGTRTRYRMRWRS